MVPADFCILAGIFQGLQLQLWRFSSALTLWGAPGVHVAYRGCFHILPSPLLNTTVARAKVPAHNTAQWAEVARQPCKHHAYCRRNHQLALKRRCSPRTRPPSPKQHYASCCCNNQITAIPTHNLPVTAAAAATEMPVPLQPEVGTSHTTSLLFGTGRI